MSLHTPAYLHLVEVNELEKRAEQARAHLKQCDVCPLQCGVDRLAGELGICKTGALARVSSYGPHPGEERPISGRKGSGTIFFARCNLRCVYCQNADISQLGFGREITADELAAIMLELQETGCHNINLVSPSHIVPQIIQAVSVAAGKGFRIPLVYNTGGYDSLEMLNLLDGIVDIYMPDMKYSSSATAKKYSQVNDYPQINQRAVLEMQRQVGDLQVDESGVAHRGLLVRHLVLPNNLAGSETVLDFLAENVSKNVYVNIMAQYHPAFLAGEYPELNRRVRPQEYRQAVEYARSIGLWRLDP